MADVAYYVLTSLGTHNKGDVISFSRDQLAGGIDVSRLIANGAIRAAAGGEIARAVSFEVESSAGLSLQVPGMVHVFTNNGAPTNGTSGSYAGKAALGSLLIDVSTTPPSLYVNTGTLASPTWTAAGGNTLPGVTSDGLTPGGMVVAGQIKSTDGSLWFEPEAIAEGDNGTIFQIRTTGAFSPPDLFELVQAPYVSGDTVSAIAYIWRKSEAPGHVYTTEAWIFEDDSDGSQNTLVIRSGGVVKLAVNNAGSIGLFGATPPARPTIGGVKSGTLVQLQTVVGLMLDALEAYGIVVDTTS